MKTIQFISLGVLLFTLTVRCSRIRPKKVEKTLVEGIWKVTKFTSNGVDETGQYTACNFQFFGNGEVRVTVSSTTILGSWSVSTIRGDVDEKGTRFYIQFPASYHLEELNKDWFVKNISDEQVSLEETSDSTGKVDYLTFTQN